MENQTSSGTFDSTPHPVRPRVKLWFESAGEPVLCQGLRDILRGVEQTGSIKLAAEQVERSYRFVWARIKETETLLGETLVETHVGGSGSRRSDLTDLARDLVQTFDELRDQIATIVDQTVQNRLQAVLARHREVG